MIVKVTGHLVVMLMVVALSVAAVVVLPTPPSSASALFTGFSGHWTTIDCPFTPTGDVLPCDEDDPGSDVAIMGDDFGGSVMTLFVGEGDAPRVLVQDSLSIGCDDRGSPSTRYIGAGAGEYEDIFLWLTFTKSGCGTFMKGGFTSVQLYHDPGSDTLWEDEDGDGVGLIWQRSGSIGPSVFAWDPALDWRVFPDQMNPSTDSYGNSAVWSYRASTSFLHVPETYQLLPNYVAAFELWTDPAYVNLFVAHGYPSILMHSYGGRVIGLGRNSILAWTSPVNSRVTVNGNLHLPPLSECAIGGGIIWSIDKGADSLVETVVPAGGTTDFDFSTVVHEGETLYFIHDPGFDSNCDGAVVNLDITKP